jgi:hypothetical protein
MFSLHFRHIPVLHNFLIFQLNPVQLRHKQRNGMFEGSTSSLLLTLSRDMTEDTLVFEQYCSARKGETRSCQLDWSRLGVLYDPPSMTSSVNFVYISLARNFIGLVRVFDLFNVQRVFGVLFPQIDDTSLFPHLPISSILASPSTSRLNRAPALIMLDFFTQEYSVSVLWPAFLEDCHWSYEKCPSPDNLGRNISLGIVQLTETFIMRSRYPSASFSFIVSIKQIVFE